MATQDIAKIGLASLQAKKQAFLQENDLLETINIEEIEVDSVSKNGNCLYHATTSKGNKVWFWETTVDDIFDLSDDETMFELKPTTNRLEDGSLVPQGQGFKRRLS